MRLHQQQLPPGRQMVSPRDGLMWPSYPMACLRYEYMFLHQTVNKFTLRDLLQESLAYQCGKNTNKPPTWERFIPPIYGDSGDGSCWFTHILFPVYHHSCCLNPPPKFHAVLTGVVFAFGSHDHEARPLAGLVPGNPRELETLAPGRFKP